MQFRKYMILIGIIYLSLVSFLTGFLMCKIIYPPKIQSDEGEAIIDKITAGTTSTSDKS